MIVLIIYPIKSIIHLKKFYQTFKKVKGYANTLVLDKNVSFQVQRFKIVWNKSNQRLLETKTTGFKENHVVRNRSELAISPPPHIYAWIQARN